MCITIALNKHRFAFQIGSYWRWLDIGIPFVPEHWDFQFSPKFEFDKPTDVKSIEFCVGFCIFFAAYKISFYCGRYNGLRIPEKHKAKYPPQFYFKLMTGNCSR